MVSLFLGVVVSCDLGVFLGFALMVTLVAAKSSALHNILVQTQL